MDKITIRVFKNRNVVKQNFEARFFAGNHSHNEIKVSGALKIFIQTINHSVLLYEDLEVSIEFSEFEGKPSYYKELSQEEKDGFWEYFASSNVKLPKKELH